MRWKDHEEEDLMYADLGSNSSGIFTADAVQIKDNVNLMALADVAVAERLRHMQAAEESIDEDSSDDEEIRAAVQPEPWRPWQEPKTLQVGARRHLQQHRHQNQQQEQQ
ncbi:uncharacterized protein LOC117174957 [Belonocnema kinseyi]|uniref:uncharacterized protein LOC117174957 n=1 Tax=Belonocnema kinseyi TaxID=2817044 RepID=UPI00143D7209|nr:uncharacterized protein LOC117174957 [Belonocnema kinseyi]